MCVLCCLYSPQLRVLRNDFARYNLSDDESDELDQDDYGWKIISTDVFRFPPHKSLLCAVLGNLYLLWDDARPVLLHKQSWEEATLCIVFSLDLLPIYIYTYIHTCYCSVHV